MKETETDGYNPPPANRLNKTEEIKTVMTYKERMLAAARGVLPDAWLYRFPPHASQGT